MNNFEYEIQNRKEEIEVSENIVLIEHKTEIIKKIHRVQFEYDVFCAQVDYLKEIVKLELTKSFSIAEDCNFFEIFEKEIALAEEHLRSLSIQASLLKIKTSEK